MMPKTGRACLSSWIAATLLLGSLAYALAEEITLTTYYPSPRGVYKELRTTDNTYLAIDGGNVGIGTTAPNAAGFVSSIRVLTISSAGNQPGALELRNESPTAGPDSVGHLAFTGGSTELARITGATETATTIGSLRFLTNPGGGVTEQMRIMPNGRVGIGTTSPGRLLHVSGPGLTDIRVQSTGGNENQASISLQGGATNANWMVGTNMSGTFGAADSIGIFKGDGTIGAKLVIQDNGNVGINTTNPAVRLHVVGQIRGSDITTDMSWGGTGPDVCWTDAGDNFYFLRRCGSSAQLKHDIASLSIDKRKVFDLRPVRFKWNENGLEDVGLIAEEVSQSLPELVSYQDGKPMSVKYAQLSIYLLDILRAQDQELQKLKTNLEALMADNAALKARLDASEDGHDRQAPNGDSSVASP